MASHEDMLKNLARASDSFRDLFAPPRMPEIKMPDIKPSPLVTIAEQSIASEFHDRLVHWIKAFDAELDSAHEVGARLVNFGQTFVFHLENLGYWDPALIYFEGRTEDGQRVKLIQHVSQISVALMALPREDPSTPKQPFGFQSIDEARRSEQA